MDTVQGLAGAKPAYGLLIIRTEEIEHCLIGEYRLSLPIQDKYADGDAIKQIAQKGHVK